MRRRIKEFELLTSESLSRGLRILSGRDTDLAQILKNLGPPPMWSREPGFPTLVRIILEQQVSLASAKAAYNRLLAATSPLTPESFLNLSDAALKSIGFSRQKISYARHLAGLIVAGQLDLASLSVMNDEAVRAELLKVKGVGNWTIDIYLLMALSRVDVWPSGDLALAVAVKNVKRLSSRPTPGELAIIGTEWKPWRSVATRIFWHYYLNS